MTRHGVHSLRNHIQKSMKPLSLFSVHLNKSPVVESGTSDQAIVPIHEASHRDLTQSSFLH